MPAGCRADIIGAHIMHCVVRPRILSLLVYIISRSKNCLENGGKVEFSKTSYKGVPFCNVTSLAV